MNQFKWIGACLAVLMLVLVASPALADTAKGKIKTIAADKNEFTMTTVDNKELTFRFEKDVKVQLNDKNHKLSDLRAGDQVTVEYTRDGDRLNVREVRAIRSKE